MATIERNGVRIAYEDIAEGRPILLVHGFASNRALNWKATNWVETLKGAGYRVVAVDLRGHGESDKPHDAAAYTFDEHVADLIGLLDGLGIERAEVMGYSMGARITLQLIRAASARFRHAILAGVGENLLKTVDPETVASALEAPSLDAVTDPVGRTFRAFADRQRGDLAALAACWRATRKPIDIAEAGQVEVPVLVVAGEKDDMTGSPFPLAEKIRGAEAAVVPGKDHMTAVADGAYKQAVLEFLATGT